MIINFNTNRYFHIQLCLLVIAFIFFSFWLQGNQGFSLWDEGFLWYGVQRTIQGEVPLRDFMSYDPGRYYWSAWLMSLWDDDGIMSLRRAVAIFQGFGLLAGLILVFRNVKKTNFLYLLLFIIVLSLWMFPRHKLFDISLSIFLIGVLTYLIEKPLPLRYFFSGVCLGLIAVFGRNHGLYGFVGSLGVIFWLHLNNLNGYKFCKSLTIWICGVTVGFIPILYMLLFVPGFGTAFWDSIRFLFEVKTTNLTLPVPWPWTVNWNSNLINILWGITVGLLFLSVIVFGIVAPIAAIILRIKNKIISPVIVASSFLGLPYAHYALSRADVGHLAQGIFPLLIASLSLLLQLPSRLKLMALIVIFFISLLVVRVYNPWWECYKNFQCMDVVVSHNRLKVSPDSAADIGLLRELNYKYTPNAENFLVLPFWPGSYSLLNRKSPIWEIYALFPRLPNFERQEIERIKASEPKFIFVFNLALDQREELRYKNTHPLTFKYIIDNYNRISGSPNSAYEIYEPKIH